jgi:hypothetical protein
MSSADTRTTPADRFVAAALAGSAAASAAVPDADLGPVSDGDATFISAARAWRWVVGTEALDLYAVHGSSAQWRATCVGAGGALHRACVALAADGLAPRVTLLPDAPARWDPSSPDAPAEQRRRSLLARLIVAGTVEVTDEARALYDATDADEGRAQVDNQAPQIPPSRSVVRDLVGAARGEGVRLRLLRDHVGLVGILHGPDTRDAWLRAGMAASAVRLLARRHGLVTVTSALPNTGTRRRASTSLLAVPPLRTAWRRIGDREGWLTVGISTPYLRLRLSA